MRTVITYSEEDKSEGEQREREIGEKLENHFITKPSPDGAKQFTIQLKSRQKMSRHDSLHVFRQLFSSRRMRGWISQFLSDFVFP